MHLKIRKENQLSTVASVHMWQGHSLSIPLCVSLWVFGVENKAIFNFQKASQP